MTERDLYLEWAAEIVEAISKNTYMPYFQGNHQHIARALAKKLKTDLEKGIVKEWFCDGCNREEKTDIRMSF